MYTPTPNQAVQTIMAYAIPCGEKSFLDMATMASNAADRLEELAATTESGDRKAKMLKAARDNRKRSNLYIERYMAGEVWNPMPTF